MNKKIKKHKQSKYFTLMLVPYSSNKTRSIKIPYIFLQSFFVGLTLLITIAVGTTIRTKYYINKANQYNKNIEELGKINSELLKEKIEIKTDIELQKMTYEQRLEYYRQKVTEFDEKIQELDKAKASLYDTLSKKTDTSNIALMDGNIIEIDPDGDLETVFSSLEQKIDNQMADYEELIIKVEKAKPYLEAVPTIWPVKGRITCYYGYRANPFTGRGQEFHNGLDIKAQTGTNVKAAGGGTVIYAGWQNGYGNLVGIRHINGIESYYGHNSNVLVSVGQKVKRGDVIAKSGNTGRSTGPHVHYEIRVNGELRNPMDFIKED